MKIARWGVALFIVCSVAAAHAQQPAAATTVNPHEKVRRLLALTGGAAMGMQVVDQMIGTFKQAMPNVPEEFWTGMRAKIKPSDLVDLVVPVYEKHLTEADIDALIAFYSSPVGKRFVEKQPAILADSMKVGQAWGEKVAQEVVDDLQKKGYGPKQP